MRAILPGPRVIPVPPCPRTALRLDRDFYLRFLGGVLASSHCRADAANSREPLHLPSRALAPVYIGPINDRSQTHDRIHGGSQTHDRIHGGSQTVVRIHDGRRTRGVQIHDGRRTRGVRIHGGSQTLVRNHGGRRTRGVRIHDGIQIHDRIQSRLDRSRTHDRIRSRLCQSRLRKTRLCQSRLW